MSGGANGCVCGCGAGTGTGAGTGNRPGLGALSVRIGTHSGFMKAMLARLSSADFPALRALATRERSDPAIALLDAWATVADVLAFYQERIANEGYLRTATERRSVGELGRLVGYELRPGVASSVFLAFTLDEGARTVIPAGTRAQSVPGPGELPQAFETSTELSARAEWNVLRPRLSRPQRIEAEMPALYLADAPALVDVGRTLLLVEPGGRAEPRRVARGITDHDGARTRVELVRHPEAAVEGRIEVRVADTGDGRGGDRARDTGVLRIGDLVESLLAPPSVPPSSAARLHRRVTDLLTETSDFGSRLLTAVRPELGERLHKVWSQLPSAVAENGEAYAFRSRAALFGATVPRPVNSDGQPQDGDWAPEADEEPDVLYLDNAHEGIVPGSWVVLESGDSSVAARVTAVTVVSRDAYGIIGRSTKVTLDTSWWAPDDDEHADISALRTTTVAFAAERLEPAEAPYDAAIGGDSSTVIDLDGVYDGLDIGRWLVIEGERMLPGGASGGTVAEPVMLAAVDQRPDPSVPGDRPHTTLRLAAAPAYRYRRRSVRVHGNVAKATHGETREEVLGAGDGRSAFQRFSLRQRPVTHVSAPTPTGVATTLRVEVNGVAWAEVRNLARAAAADPAYATARADDETTSITFGDGQRGARLPSGYENVRATYRTGIGAAGNVAAGRISLLAHRPLGLKGVVNPVPATGGADPESRERAAASIPTAVVALDRLVSVRDYEDFARTFGGVGKASARRLTDGRRQVVRVTISGDTPAPISPTSDLFVNLGDALRRYGDPFQPVVLGVRELLVVIVAARVRVAARYRWDELEPRVRAAVVEQFGYERRELGQPLFGSQVVAAMQAVPGVAWVDLDLLHAESEQSVVDRLRGRSGQDDATKRDLHPPVVVARDDQLAYLAAGLPDTLLFSEVPS